MKKPTPPTENQWNACGRDIRVTRVVRADVFDPEKEKQALCEGRGEGGFRLLSSGDVPSHATRFRACLVGTGLRVSVLAFSSRSHGEEEAVELLLDPLADGIGHLQFGAGSSGHTYETTHWPYRDPERTGMGMPEWSVTVEKEEHGEDVLWFYFFSVDCREFELGASMGLNLCRSLCYSGENSSWNLVSGIGFPDAGCFGRLWLDDTPMPEAAETEGEMAEGKKRALQLQGTYDWPDNVGSVAYTLDDLRREMAWYRDCGLERVYWLDYIDYSQWSDRVGGRWGRNIESTQESFGSKDFLPGAVEAARAAGLEFITIFKPFDLYPKERVSDTDQNFSFRRNPAWAVSPDQPLESLCLYASDDRPWPFDPDTLELWISEDNETYRQWEEPIELSEEVVERADSVWTPTGPQEGRGTRSVRRLVLRGLTELKAPFFALRWSGQQGAWRNRLYRMVELRGPDGAFCPLRLDPRDSMPGAGFDLVGRTANAPSWGRSDTGMDRIVRLDGPEGAIGFSRRPDTHLPAMFEPMFPEVRDYFLGRLRRGIEAGADGVSVRIAHHVGCDDWLSFMFAEPVLKAFRERIGRDPEPCNGDFTRIRRLRGEAYTGFLREASKMARAAGKKFTHHLENRMLAPPEYDTYLQIHWDWETWIREGLLDEVDLKYIGPDHRDCRERIVPLCREHGVKVNWITPDPEPRWKGRSIHEAPLLIDRARKGGMDGINLYELWLYHRMTDRGTPMARGCGEAIIRGMNKRIEETK